VPEPLTPRYALLLELITPYVQAAVSRVSRAEDLPQTCRTPEKLAITGREIEILRWAQLGKSNAEIGEQLHISPLTVKNHIQKILKKLNVQNRTAAVSRAIASRLIAP
jgi:DNA-binding CsgD family transcriptional regulator